MAARSAAARLELAAQLVPTPERWLDAACAHWQELLLDHANCEKKAASTALALIFAYPEWTAQNLALSRLAREELRHFEQVTRMMARLRCRSDVCSPPVTPRRCARRSPRTSHGGGWTCCSPARSSRRAPASASRCCARDCPRRWASSTPIWSASRPVTARCTWSWPRRGGLGKDDWPARLAELVAIEAELITRDDTQLRFHSGPPP